MEEELAAGLGEGQVAELMEDDEVAADELLCDTPLALGVARSCARGHAVLCLEVIDQVDDVVTAASGALADAGAGDGEMGLAGAGRSSLILPMFRVP